MACGGAKTTDYKFAYQYPSSGSSELEPAQLSFSVEPDSNPPTNIHVVIGRNGVGKTWLLKNMIGSLYHKDNASTFGEFTFDSHRTQFSNLVCLAFSAFDHFPLAQENDDDLKYTYIGIKSLYDGKEVGLDEQFAISLTTCMTNKTLYQRWKDTISVLNSDTIFSEVNLIECTDRIQANRRVYTRKLAETEIIQIFKRLSSGHKIVVLTLTRLVETVKECTLVLLDEPELHLHPPLLAAFTHALSQLLINRNGVAIVATHSPVILQEVPKSCVWVLRRSGREIVADRPERETFGENVGILTSDVFRLEVMDSGFHKMLKDVLEKANGDFEQALAKFNLQLGSEAIALLKVMSLQYGDDL
jgi:ABC-type transport system involved in cytochrome c biogenesis ATPase subunit